MLLFIVHLTCLRLYRLSHKKSTFYRFCRLKFKPELYLRMNMRAALCRLSLFNLDNKSSFNSYLISFLHTMDDTPELRSPFGASVS
jgi:hypothetical protein